MSSSNRDEVIWFMTLWAVLLRYQRENNPYLSRITCTPTSLAMNGEIMDPSVVQVRIIPSL